MRIKKHNENKGKRIRKLAWIGGFGGESRAATGNNAP